MKRHRNSATGAVFWDAGTAENRGVPRRGAVMASNFDDDASRAYWDALGGSSVLVVGVLPVCDATCVGESE